MDGLTSYCRDEMVSSLAVSEENVLSLLELVVVYEQMDGLKDKVQQFIGTKWDELTESGAVVTIMQDRRFTKIGADAVCKYHNK